MAKMLLEDGAYLYYQVEGSGFPILFLHGNRLNHTYFKKQRSLASRFKLIFLDSRGHGKSSKVEELTFYQMADDIECFLETLSIESCLIVGHSDGANLAMVYSKKYPKRIAGLLLNGGNSELTGLFWPIQLAVIAEQTFFKLLSYPIPRLRKRCAVAGLLSQNLNLSSKDFEEVSYPVYVLVGRWDLIKSSHNHILAALYPQSRLIVISGAGHNPAKSQTALFNAWIEQLYEESHS